MKEIIGTDNTMIFHLDIMPSESLAGDNDDSINICAVSVLEHSFGDSIGQYKDTVSTAEMKKKINTIVENTKQEKLNLIVLSNVSNAQTFKKNGKVLFEDFLKKEIFTVRGNRCQFKYEGRKNRIKVSYAKKLLAITYLISHPNILGLAITACNKNNLTKLALCLDTLSGDQPDASKRNLNRSIEFVKLCLDNIGLVKALQEWSLNEKLPEIHISYCATGNLTMKESKVGGNLAIADYISQSLYASLNPKSWLGLGEKRTEDDRIVLADLFFELAKLDKIFIDGKLLKEHPNTRMD